jgi:hypothetical protein
MKKLFIIYEKTYNILIGERTAENIKMEIGYAHPNHKEETMEIRGRDMVTGLPKTVTITSKEIHLALKESLGQVLETIRSTLEKLSSRAQWRYSRSRDCINRWRSTLTWYEGVVIYRIDRSSTPCSESFRICSNWNRAFFKND